MDLKVKDEGLWIAAELGLAWWIEFRCLEIWKGFQEEEKTSFHTSLGLGRSHYPTIKFALTAEKTCIFDNYSPLIHDSYTTGGLDFLGLGFSPQYSSPPSFFHKSPDFPENSVTHPLAEKGRQAISEIPHSSFLPLQPQIEESQA